VTVGQGLRTGANNFFYLDFLPAAKDKIKVSPHKTFGLSPFETDRRFFKEVIRRQSELNGSVSLSGFQPRGVVLVIENHALPEDIAFVTSCDENFTHAYSPLPEELCTYIRIAAGTRNGPDEKDALIPQLSAVAPNVRKWNKDKPDQLPRFWYMLPAFTKRHYPDLFIPRVIGDRPSVRLNENGGYLIDANFSSLWIDGVNCPYDNYALLALLNSTYMFIVMEVYGTVMGGGALKLEATQLTRLPLPRLESEDIARLMVLGKRLPAEAAEKGKVLAEIDQLLVSAMGFSDRVTEKLDQLYFINEELLNKRRHK
jgi:hypothetical protein